MTFTWRLNRVAIPEPTAFSISDVKLARTERTASGRSVSDVIAFKLKLDLSFDTLTDIEMAVFSEAYHVVGSFPFTFPYLGVSKTIDVVVGSDFNHEMLYADPELWKNIKVSLEEV
jgi:hypothetical protein